MIESHPKEMVPKLDPKRQLIQGLVALASLGIMIWLAVMVKTGLDFTSGKSPAQDDRPEIDFTVKDLSGAAVSLNSLHGKVVLVNFWATWCSPCKEEMPLLQAYYDAHKEENFTLVAVNVSDDVEDAQAFIIENGYTFPVWSDPPGNVLIDLDMNGLPASLVIDAQGKLVKRWIGPLAREDLDDIITPLFEKGK